jgi:hypothetical protein
VKDTIIAVAYLFGMMFILSISLCLLISPRHFFLLQDRLAKTHLWSRRTPTWDAGVAPQWRMLGLFLTLLSLFMLFGPLLRGRTPPSIERQSLNVLSAAPQATSHLGSLLFLFLFLALGFSFVIKPNSTVNWVVPRQTLTSDNQMRRARVLRIFGIFLVLFSFFGFFFTLYR